MAVTNGWGQGAKDNTIEWGQGASDNTISWGKSQTISAAGDTNILQEVVEHLLLQIH